jgi:hypoxanthine phosphoribosyltransferase
VIRSSTPQEKPVPSNNMDILFDEQAIDAKVRELASRISRDYAGKELVLVSILKGALIFTADLMRGVSIPVAVEFIQAASYGASTVSRGTVETRVETRTDLRGKHVLIVDTIIDSGKTMEVLLAKINAMHPASLGTVALLDKKSCRKTDVSITYSGFEIPDLFVVGYGMDYADRYRALPYIAVLQPDAEI